jgi:hypothetical protein
LDKKDKDTQTSTPSQIKKILKMLIFGCGEPVVEKKEGFFMRLFKK